MGVLHLLSDMFLNATFFAANTSMDDATPARQAVHRLLRAAEKLRGSRPTAEALGEKLKALQARVEVVESENRILRAR